MWDKVWGMILINFKLHLYFKQLHYYSREGFRLPPENGSDTGFHNYHNYELPR